jgi:hypothetical protein
VVLVPATFTRSAIPDSVVFRVVGSRGGELRGVSPYKYALGANRRPVRRPPEQGEELKGFLPGIKIGMAEDEGVARVQLPDGEIYDLRDDQLETPGRSAAHVPVES